MTTLLILAIIVCCIPLTEARIVNTRLGPVDGVSVSANPSANAPIPIPVDVYFGIPFAKPPVGELRFRPPQPITQSWSAPLQATRQPPKCVSPSGGQEDCLYLNVFAPSTPSSRPRPVMMWIYGGGYVYGNVGNYDATSLASCEDVIVVMGNYRLGALGFYSNEATMKESGTTGNWGLLDQVATMEWIQENIHAFGGDPTRVSIFGESAGAMSVIAHMVSPRSEGLFASAIIQSGTTHVDMFFQPREDAEKYNEWLAKVHLNCPGGIEDMECLRRIPASRFPIRYQERDGWGAPTWGNPIFPLFHSAPVIDGVFLPASPIVIMKNRALGNAGNGFSTVPVIIGTTQDEGSIFVTQLPFIIRPVVDFPPTEDQLVDTIDYIIHDRSLAEEIFDENYPKFKDAYPPRDEWKFATAEFQFISSMIRDVMFACPTTTFADLLFKAGYQVFMYNFGYKFWPDVSRGFPIGQILGRLGNMTVDHIGTFHSSDVPFVMKLFYSRNVTLDEIGLDTPHAVYLSPVLSQPGDLHHKVSDFMSCSWANLARCGNVVCEGVQCTDQESTWTPYTSQRMEYLSIGPNGSLSTEVLPATGKVGVDAHYPSMEKCLWYRDKIQTPFHDLRADLRLDSKPSPLGMRIDDGASMSDRPSKIVQVHLSLILGVFLIMSLI
jgi:carboxylesterase type B